MSVTKLAAQPRDVELESAGLRIRHLHVLHFVELALMQV